MRMMLMGMVAIVGLAVGCGDLADYNMESDRMTGRTTLGLIPTDGVPNDAGLDQKLGAACDVNAHVNQACNGHEVGVPAFCWNGPEAPEAIGKCVAWCLDTNAKPSMTDPLCTKIGGHCSVPGALDDPICIVHP